MRWSRPTGLTFLSVTLLILLPALAVLQYRWVGQVSVAERERMQRNLRNAAVQFRDSFDAEIGRAFGALQVGANTARDGFSEPYSDRYEAWVAVFSCTGCSMPIGNRWPSSCRRWLPKVVRTGAVVSTPRSTRLTIFVIGRMRL